MMRNISTSSLERRMFRASGALLALRASPAPRLPLLLRVPSVREFCRRTESPPSTPSAAAGYRRLSSAASAAGRRRLSTSPQSLAAAGADAGAGAASAPPSAAAQASTAAAAEAQDGALQCSGRKMRNVCVIAHVDHGKTSLVSFASPGEERAKARRLAPSFPSFWPLFLLLFFPRRAAPQVDSMLRHCDPAYGKGESMDSNPLERERAW